MHQFSASVLLLKSLQLIPAATQKTFLYQQLISDDGIEPLYVDLVEAYHYIYLPYFSFRYTSDLLTYYI